MNREEWEKLGKLEKLEAALMLVRIEVLKNERPEWEVIYDSLRKRINKIRTVCYSL